MKPHTSEFEISGRSLSRRAGEIGSSRHRVRWAERISFGAARLVAFAGFFVDGEENARFTAG